MRWTVECPHCGRAFYVEKKRTDRPEVRQQQHDNLVKWWAEHPEVKRGRKFGSKDSYKRGTRVDKGLPCPGRGPHAKKETEG